MMGWFSLWQRELVAASSHEEGAGHRVLRPGPEVGVTFQSSAP